MKTFLTDKIKHNREAFDHAVPPTGHFERFEQKLARSEQKRVRQFRHWITASSIAAMLAVTLVFQFTHTHHALPAETESVTEVAGYYKLQLNEEVNKIQKKLDKLDTSNRQEIREDLRVILKDSEKVPSGKIPLTVDEQISFIVLHYHAKMETLQHIHSMIENIPNKNNNL